MSVCVGIAGGTGSGKTTLARALAESFGGNATVIAEDWYYRDQAHIPFEQRLTVNYDHPDAVERDRLARDVALLKAGHAVAAPQYDFTTHTRCAAANVVEPRAVLIVEGLHVLCDEPLRRLLDFKVFLDAPPDVRLMRRIRRDAGERARSVESVLEQYLRNARPMHELFVAPSIRYADLIIEEDCDTAMAIARIVQVMQKTGEPE